MSVIEKEFEQELEAFRVSAETAAQFFYAFQAIHFLSSRDKTVLGLLEQAPMFWNTNVGALRDAMFIALGRIFDKDGRTHNIYRLLEVAEDNADIFKMSSPRWHKNGEANQTLNDVVSVYEPQLGDWQRLCRHVDKWREVYSSNYKSIRDKVFAHRERINPGKTTELFEQTSYVELEKLFAFLDALHKALWEIYYTGHKPVIRYRRRSLVQMLTLNTAGRRGLTAGELVALDARKFLESHTLHKTVKSA